MPLNNYLPSHHLAALMILTEKNLHSLKKFIKRKILAASDLRDMFTQSIKAS